jgi:hypothetical protein
MEGLRGDRKPFVFALRTMEQKAVEIAVDRGEENVVEGGEGHCRWKLCWRALYCFGCGLGNAKGGSGLSLVLRDKNQNL